MFQRQPCSHMSQINDVEPSAEGCEGCLRRGETWMHLRECLICGHVGCCDQSVPLQRRNPLPLWSRASLPRAGLISYSLGA
jgi:hypothetical protein